MTEQEMCDDDDRTIKSLIGEIPDWLDVDLWENQCESGSFMPAVTYWSAKAAMHSWGDQILAYIEDRLGDVPAPDDKNRSSWGTLACFYVSVAVELWAADTLAALEDIDIAED